MLTGGERGIAKTPFTSKFVNFIIKDMAIEHEEKDEAVELTVYSKGGRFYQKSKEGEWVDVYCSPFVKLGLSWN